MCIVLGVLPLQRVNLFLSERGRIVSLAFEHRKTRGWQRGMRGRQKIDERLYEKRDERRLRMGVDICNTVQPLHASRECGGSHLRMSIATRPLSNGAGPEYQSRGDLDLESPDCHARRTSIPQIQGTGQGSRIDFPKHVKCVPQVRGSSAGSRFYDASAKPGTSRYRRLSVATT